MCLLYIKISVLYGDYSGAYTEIVIRGGPGIEVEVNLASDEAQAVIDLGGSGGMLPEENFWNIYHKWCIIRWWFGNKNLLDYCCSKILHSSVNLVYYLMVNPDI